MRNHRLFQFSIAQVWASTLLVIIIPVIASADVLVSNLTEPYRADTPIANPQYWAAQSFLTAGNGVWLDSIDVIVGNGVGSPNVVAELRSADGLGEMDLSAAGLLTTFSIPVMTGATSARTFTPNSLVQLYPSTRYWFLLGSSNAGAYDWSYADTGFNTGPGIISDFADSSDAGATWLYQNNANPYFIQVNVSAIPEPSSGWMMIGVLAGLIKTVRHRRRFERSRLLFQ